MFASRFNRIAAWLVALLLIASAWVLAERYLDGGATTGLPVVQPEDCDLNAGPCVAELPAGGTITLAITPRPVPMLRELQLRLVLDEQAQDVLGMPDSLELDLAGVEMFMGYQRPTLQYAGEGRYRGATTLPICVTASMTWAATVMPVDAPDNALAQFRFVTARDH